MGISEDRVNRDNGRVDARVAWFEHIKRDSDRGMTNTQIAEKHQVSESSVRAVLSGAEPTDAEVFKIALKQLGTENTTVITVMAPKGTTYREVVEQLRQNV